VGLSEHNSNAIHNCRKGLVLTYRISFNPGEAFDHVLYLTKAEMNPLVYGGCK